MQIFNYDPHTMLYIGPSTADLDPEERDADGELNSWIMPAFSTTTPPPADMPGNNIVWMGEQWGYQAILLPDAPPSVEPSTVYEVSKMTLWVRLSDEEADTLEAGMATQTARMRGIWNAASIIRSDSEFFGTLEQFMTAVIGPERTAEVLAPEFTMTVDATTGAVSSADQHPAGAPEWIPPTPVPDQTYNAPWSSEWNVPEQ